MKKNLKKKILNSVERAFAIVNGCNLPLGGGGGLENARQVAHTSHNPTAVSNQNKSRLQNGINQQT